MEIFFSLGPKLPHFYDKNNLRFAQYENLAILTWQTLKPKYPRKILS
jgi:hypothetical protein